MSDKTRQTIISLLIGAGTGLFMSIVMLYMMIAEYFAVSSFSFVLIVIAACALPFCVSFLRKTEWNVLMIQITMILTSFLITIFYGIYLTNANAISGYSSLWQQVTIASGIAHGAALCVTLLYEMILHRRTKK